MAITTAVHEETLNLAQVTDPAAANNGSPRAVTRYPRCCARIGQGAGSGSHIHGVH